MGVVEVVEESLLTSTCSCSPSRPVLVSMVHWLAVEEEHSITSSSTHAGLGGRGGKRRRRRRGRWGE